MNDPSFVRLACVIQQGWPESGKELYDDIKPCYKYRFDLHIVNGIIILQNRIMVPIGLRCQFLEKIHEPHLGVVKSKLLTITLVLA